MHTINIKCPFCPSYIKVNLNQNFEIESIECDEEIVVSDDEIQKILIENGIEFG